jgi:putative ABC transport system ATP-binding protein
MIALKDVTKVYRRGAMGVDALRSVSLEVGVGEWVAIMGPSGCGKSTLMNIIGCLDAPTSGSYRLDGTEVSGLSDDQLADLRSLRFGFVFQSFNLLPRTPAVRQVMLPMQYLRNGRQLDAHAREQRARSALDMVGLADRLDHRPSQLSGGECQRVAMARALANDPQIILADEPTGNLDSRSGAEIIDLLARLHAERNLTIVMVTHDEHLGQRAGRVVRLYDGEIVSGGAS